MPLSISLHFAILLIILLDYRSLAYLSFSISYLFFSPLEERLQV